MTFNDNENSCGYYSFIKLSKEKKTNWTYISKENFRKGKGMIHDKPLLKE